MVGQAFAEGAVLVVFVLDVFRDRVLPGDAFGDLPVEFAEFAVLLLQQLLDIEHLVAGEFAQADPGVVRQVWVVAPDALRQRGPQAVDARHLALAIPAPADRGRHFLDPRLVERASVAAGLLLDVEILLVELLIAQGPVEGKLFAFGRSGHVVFPRTVMVRAGRITIRAGRTPQIERGCACRALAAPRARVRCFICRSCRLNNLGFRPQAPSLRRLTRKLCPIPIPQLEKCARGIRRASSRPSP